nr:geraniol 8-hydroxylase-like [Ipomoea batatas]
MFKSFGAMSPSIFHRNEFNNDPSITGTILNAIGIAGQILRPAPNGISSKSRPLASISEFQNLSGLNSNGFFQILGSRPIAHTLNRILESLGMVYPHRTTSCSTLRGSKSGAGGCSLNVSFTMHCRTSGIERAEKAKSCFCRASLAMADEEMTTVFIMPSFRLWNSEIDVRERDFEFVSFSVGRKICPAILMALKMVPVMLSLLNSFWWKIESDNTKGFEHGREVWNYIG